MAGVKIPITDFLTKLASLQVNNGDGNTVFPYVRIWNNQVAYQNEGKMEAWSMPAFFVEIVNNAIYQDIGQYFRSADISFRVHIVQEYYDAQDGTFEQDLLIFDLRDMVIANCTAFELTACGPLIAVAEAQDYEHTNVYHYIIDFICNFTDSIGSKYDPGHSQAYIESIAPTDLELEASTKTQTETTLFTVAQGKAYSTKYTATTEGENIFLVLDGNGNMIIGSNIVSVTKEIYPLVPAQWNWNSATSVMTLLGGVTLGLDESAFIIFQQNIY